MTVSPPDHSCIADSCGDACQQSFVQVVGDSPLQQLRFHVQIAAIFEFAGALLLGRVSTNVIAGGIADINAFTNSPEAYAYGMVCALGVGTLWLIVTSMLGLNVSSTHSISKSRILINSQPHEVYICKNRGHGT